jgi:hypothetical protein
MVGVNDLSNNDSLIGFRSGSPGVGLFWATPTSQPTELPPLHSGYDATAVRFQGTDVIGRAGDTSGTWVVRWVNSVGAWSVQRIALMSPGANGPGGMNFAGRIGLQSDNGPAVWDPPYTQPPVKLPTLSGTAGSTRAVLEDGTVVGVVTASSKMVKNLLPVIWPAPASLVRLPLLSGGKYGEANGVNSYRQIAGSVQFVEGWATIDHAVIWTLP